MSVKVIHQPRPRYVIETGTVEVTFSDGSEVIEWSFHSAHEIEDFAITMADRLAREYKHVRVVDRGAE